VARVGTVGGMVDNPYAAPKAPLLDSEADDHEVLARADALALRRDNLRVERRIQTWGDVMIGWGVIVGIPALPAGIYSSYLVAVSTVPAWVKMWAMMAVLALTWGPPAFLVATGQGLRRFRHRAARLTILLAVGALVVVPFGTFMGWSMLRTMSSAPARTVFSPEHAAARHQTPHIRPPAVVGDVLAGILLPLLNLALLCAFA